MTNPIEVKFDLEAMYELSPEGFKIYMWMKVYLPKYGYEVSYREIADMLQMSPSTVNKHMNIMVEKGFIERYVDIGRTATYKVLR